MALEFSSVHRQSKGEWLMPAQWPIRPPQELRLPMAKPLVAQIARRGRVSEPELAVAATKLLRMAPPSGNFRQDMQLFCDLAVTIHNHKLEAVGVRRSPETTGALTEHVAGQIAAGCMPTLVEFDQFVALKQQLLDSRDEVEAMMFYRVSMMVDVLAPLCQLRSWLSAFQQMPDLSRQILDKALPDLSEINQQIMDELLGLRHYGVKTAFFQDGYFHSPGEAWVVVDNLTLVQAGGIDTGSSDSVAHLFLAEQADLAGVDVRIDQRPLAVNGWKFDHLEYGFDPLISLVIDREGHIQFRRVATGMDPAQVFDLAGQSEMYEVFRMIQIMRLYDLVMPTETVAGMPRMQRKKAKGLARLKRESDFPNLVLPRLRSLDIMGKLREQLEREVEEADRSTAERGELSRHEVINHIRQLPEGRHPTPQARQRAREELGIELGPNETYVRKHERGDGPKKAKVHRAKTKRR